MKAFLISVLILFSFSSLRADPGSDPNNAMFRKYFDEITHVDVFIDAEQKSNHISAKLLIESGHLAVPFLVKEISNTSNSNVRSIGLLQEPKKAS